MKRIPLTYKIILISLMSLLLSTFYSCIDDVEGTFYLSNKANKYLIDTTTISFNMVDNTGITESYVMDQYTWYNQHHYFEEWGTNGNVKSEVFGVTYESVINGYHFMYVLRANENFTSMDIEWNQTDRMEFNLDTDLLISGLEGRITYYDSIDINGTVYCNAMEFDFTHLQDQISNKTPVKFCISAQYGLVKTEFKNGVVAERE